MSKVVLFISMSVDGYIATSDGAVDWLHAHQEVTQVDNEYEKFYAQVTQVVLGRKTYDQIVNELSVGEYPYENVTSYVITSKERLNQKNVVFTEESAGTIVRRLKQEDENYIWIVGGATTIQELLKEDLIDEYQIAVIPTILGRGIRLFEEFDNRLELILDSVKAINGLTYLTYNRKCTD